MTTVDAADWLIIKYPFFKKNAGFCCHSPSFSNYVPVCDFLFLQLVGLR